MKVNNCLAVLSMCNENDRYRNLLYIKLQKPTFHISRKTSTVLKNNMIKKT